MVEFLVEGVPWDLQTSQANVSPEGCSLKTNKESHWQGQHPHSSLKSKEVKLVAAWSFHPYILVSLLQKGTLQATERETWTPTQLQNYPPTTCSAYKM